MTKASIAALPVVELLSRIPLFSGLAGDELQRLAQGCRLRSYPRDNILFHKGDPCLGFYMVLSGQVKLTFATASGHQKVIDIINAGQTFGEALMFLRQPYMLMGQTLVSSQLLHIDQKTLFSEIESTPHLAHRLLAGLSRRLHHLVCQMETLALHNGSERLIDYLLREARKHCALPLAGEFLLRLPAKKETIASLLNMTQEHFSRVLHELAGQGLIEIRGRDIFIPDIARLEASLG